MATPQATTNTGHAAHTLQIIYTRDGYTQVQPIEFPQNLAHIIPQQQWVSFIQHLSDIGQHATRSKQCSCCYYSCGCKVCTYIWLVFCLICLFAWLSALISALTSNDDGISTFGFTYQVCMYSVFIIITLWAMWSCRKEVRKGMQQRYQTIIGECQVLQSAVYNRIEIKSTPPGQYSGSHWMTEIFININTNIQIQQPQVVNYVNTQQIPLTVQQPTQYQQGQPQQIMVQMANGQYVQAQVIGQGQPQQQGQIPAVNPMPYNPNAISPSSVNEGGDVQNVVQVGGEGAVTNY